MKNISIFLLKLFLFWMALFAFLRMGFLTYNFNRLTHESIFSVLQSFWYALPLDISAACYLLSLSLLLTVASFIFPLKILMKINRVYIFIMIVVVAIIYGSELLLYDEWNSKIHYKIFVHLSRPSEVFRTASNYHMLVFFPALIIYSITAIFIFNKYFYTQFAKFEQNFLTRLLITPIILIISIFFLVMGFRGGFREMPINQSVVYYSKNNFLNAAAINSPWNLIHSIIENRKSFYENPFVFHDMKGAKERTAKLYEVTEDSTIKILTTQRPNIVLFILESWSGNVIKSLGGDFEVTPNFDSLANEGVLFTNLYASGWTSDLGMASILSAYPALPIAAIISQQNKFMHVRCVNQLLQEQGYYTSYYFGGELNYGNIKSYLVYHEFDRVMEQNDFDSKLPAGRLGIYDEYVFNYHIDAMKNEVQPFFSTIFNLSSHSPYDMPIKEMIYYSDKENPYINSVHYTDSCLGLYFREARKQPWYDNTLFILIADHSHNTHRKIDPTDPDHNTIPLLFYGNVIKKEFRGTKVKKIGSQTDLLATWLPQMNINAKEFIWSKNLLNPNTPEFAFYTFHDIFGWVTPQGFFVFQNILKKNIQEKFEVPEVKDSIVQDGKSYMQTLFQQYLDF